MSSRRFLRSAALVAALLALDPAAGHAQTGTGRIEGRVTVAGGSGHAGVAVVVQELQRATLTDSNGVYTFGSVPAGTYTLVFTYGDYTATTEGVVVDPGQTATSDLSMDWDLTFSETLTVYSASRTQERIVEAPAAVTVVSEQEVAQKAATGQLPKLLEFTPGVAPTQSGLYDYNFNTRGFNSSLNRRVATLIDGRSPAVPFLGAQEWSALSFPLDDVAGLELVRGPSAALYGQNASSGVLNITTKQPRYSEGGQVRLTVGELDTTNVDFRWAKKLGAGWYIKLNAGLRDTGDFSVSRNNPTRPPEYSRYCVSIADTDCLPLESAALSPENDDKILLGGLRFDKYWDNGSALTFEGGNAGVEGPVTVTGIGRVQLKDVKRPWGRVNYNMDHWNFLGYWTGRRAPEQTSLQVSPNISNKALSSDRFGAEVQTNWEFDRQKGRVVGGVSYFKDRIDSTDPNTGMETLLFAPTDGSFAAAFGQVDYQATRHIKIVVAARYDVSTLHEDFFSPKASLVGTINPNHALRLTYNRAFQVANYSEFFLDTQVRDPELLATFQAICLGNGVTDCGFDQPTPVLAVGNANLDLEVVDAIEVGYNGIFGNQLFLSVDYYRANNDQFITDLLPNVGTSLGRINPDFGPWVGSQAAQDTTNVVPTPAPPGLSVQDTIRVLCAGDPKCGGLLSNNVDGSNAIAAVSYTNFGEVESQGAELGMRYFHTDHWSTFLTYAWFDFEAKDADPALASQLLPNTPEHMGSVGVAYGRDGFDSSLSFRWSDEFRWVTGPFKGNVPSYTAIDLVANYRFAKHWMAGLNVANLLDDVHYESFGGDLIGRRALVSLGFDWE